MRDPIDEIREALAHPDFLERIDAIRGYDVAEKRLLDRLEAAEKERDALRAAVRHEADCVEACKSELAQLRKDADKFGDGIDWIQRALQAEARIEAMERQKPVAEWTENRFHRYPQLDWADGYKAAIGEKLYALPCAKGE